MLGGRLASINVNMTDMVVDDFDGDGDGDIAVAGTRVISASEIYVVENEGSDVYETFTETTLTGNVHIEAIVLINLAPDEGPPSESGTYLDIIFGLDDGTCSIFEQGTPYRQPDFLNTVITRLYPGEEFIQGMESTIHAFLLSHPGLEFGAVTPKGDHLSINIAGRNVTSKIMMEFLRSAPVQRFLPAHQRREKPLNYFKGKFPIAPARNLFGDRYVMIGDAAGLMRPFKGKGINSAIITGMYAARSIMRHGISKDAFAQNFYKDCSELTEDLPYGRAVRVLTNLATRFKFMDHMIAVAAERTDFMHALFNSVSGHDPYKKILWETASLSLAFTFAQKFLGHFVFNQNAQLPVKRPSPIA